MGAFRRFWQFWQFWHKEDHVRASMLVLVTQKKYISKYSKKWLIILRPHYCQNCQNCQNTSQTRVSFALLAEVVRGCYISPAIFSGSDTFWHLLAVESDTCLGTISSGNHTTLASDM